MFLWLVLLSLFLGFCCFFSMKLSESASLCLCVHLLSDPFSVSRVCYLIHCDLLFTSSLFILLCKYSYSFPASPLLFSFTKYFNLAHLITWNPDWTEQRAEMCGKCYSNAILIIAVYYHLFMVLRRRKWCFLTHTMWRDSTLNISSGLLFCNLIKFEIGFQWSPLEPPGSAAKPALI